MAQKPFDFSLYNKQEKHFRQKRKCFSRFRGCQSLSFGSPLKSLLRLPHHSEGHPPRAYWRQFGTFSRGTRPALALAICALRKVPNQSKLICFDS